MRVRKQRLTVTVDPELVDAGNQAVAAGNADSLSGWVSRALVEQVRRDRKIEHLHAAISDYEAEFGEITSEEIAAHRRVDRENAVVVRGHRSSQTGSVGNAGRTKSA